MKFHLSLNVVELARSVEFYTKLFGQAPAKLRCDYAKFELNEPPVVLSLIPMMGAQPAGRLNHIGIRLLDSAALVALQARLEIGGCPTTREDGVECCYSKQTKFWVTDPDGTLWEFYVLHADGDTHEDHDHDRHGEMRSSGGEVCPKPAMRTAGEVCPKPVMNRTPISATQMPASGPLPILNVPEPTEVVRQHMLTQTLDRPPNLPGLASLVQHVPTEAEAVAAFERAGLTGVKIAKLNEQSCFVVGPAEVRETKIEGTKPRQTAASAETMDAIPVLLKGPLRQMSDDFGFTYRRGVRTPASPERSRPCEPAAWPISSRYSTARRRSSATAAGSGTQRSSVAS